MKQRELDELLKIAVNASISAGEKILEVYKTEFEVEIKEDSSPLTKADRLSNTEIVGALDKTAIPVLSEEGRDIPYTERRQWEYLWIVDPLDGTKEFVKKNGEFTVNIALVRNQKPVLGVIYKPVSRELYFALINRGAFKTLALPSYSSPDEIIAKSEVLTGEKKPSVFTAVASRSHLNPETESYLNEMKKKYGEINYISAGSSLKFCLVAEGLADIYPRFAPTMEWDTAAGQIIVELTGKNVIDYETDAAMLYNKEVIRNNWFLVK